MFGGLLGGLKSMGGDLLKQLLTGNGLDAAGRALGAVGQTQASNRGTMLDAMMAGDEMKMASARERRADETDIMKKIQMSEYLKGGGANYAPSASVTGKPLGQFDFGVRPATETESQMAGELAGQLKQRLSNPLQLSDYSSQMKPGTMESIANWGGPLLSLFGAARGAGRYTPPTAQTQTPQTPANPEAATPAPSPFVADISNAGRGRDPWNGLF
jgi:hypothetical protein